MNDLSANTAEVAPLSASMPLGCVRLLRALDAMVIGLSSVILVLLHAPLRNTISGKLANVYILPLILVAGAVFFLPEPQASAGLQQKWRRLQFAALLAVTMAPFVSWWVRAFTNLYLLSCALLGIVAVVAFLMQIAAFCAELLQRCQQSETLLALSRRVRDLLLYVSLAPVLAVIVAGALVIGFSDGITLNDVQMIWYQVPHALRLTVLLPVVISVLLLWRTRTAVMATKLQL